MAKETPTILVVDDTEAERYYVARVLRKAGFEVREGLNGTEALTLAQDQPDLITLDVRLPDINGFDVCRRLKADPATRDIPVLHISASYTSAESKAEGLEGGADGYLTHPADPAELVATVRALLRVRWAEARVRAAAREWVATFDLIDDAVCLTDADGRVLRCNRAFAELLARPFPDIVGRPLGELLPAMAPLLENGAAGAAEVRIGDRHFRVSSGTDASGDPAGASTRAWVLGDVTEQHHAQEQLQQAHRLEAVGRLAGGVAHETNNQMTVVLGCANFALRHGGLPSDVRGDLEQIRKAAERTASITAQLLAFGRRQVSRPEVTDLAAGIRRLQPILERAAGPLATVELRLGHDPVLATVDPGQLDQVLLNLVMNGRDAMPLGGRVTVEAARARLEPPLEGWSVGEEIPGGDYVRVTVSDTGHGMDDATLRRAFEPFFTTKGVGQGTGLGLSMVYGIVRQNGGYISVSSEVGKGTRFVLYFPEATERARRADAAPRGTTSVRARTVLLVEDDPNVRAILVRELESEKYRVLEAEDGRAALERIRTHQGPLDVVITDVQMPGLDGRSLADALAELRPGVPVVYMSGHPDGEIIRELTGSGKPFLQKPFTGEELAYLVEGSLGRDPD